MAFIYSSELKMVLLQLFQEDCKPIKLIKRSPRTRSWNARLIATKPMRDIKKKEGKYLFKKSTMNFFSNCYNVIKV